MSEIKPAPLTAEEYLAKYEICKINPDHLYDLKWIARQILKHKDRYDIVAFKTGMPWYLLASLHSLEASMDFNTYIQNGDPLFNKEGDPIKTTHVPAGVGPYMSWEESCIAAFRNKKGPWDLGSCLKFAEEYNGIGYRKRCVPTPYLWSYTDQYVKGKYKADHTYDPEAQSKQPGVAAIFKVLGVAL